MTNGSLASNRVVDLLRYKSERRQQRLDFEAAPAVNRTPSLATVAPFRPLTGDEVEHRRKMLQHLAKTR